jgi:phage tail sheath protein FI
MTSYSRPGVFVSEVALPQDIQALGNGSAVGAFLGDLPKGPTVPTLVSSWSEFVKTYTSYSAAFPTTFAAYQYFANGGRQLLVRRVLGSSSAAAEITLSDRAQSPVDTLTVKAINPGEWGNDLAVKVLDGGANRFSLLVFGAPLTLVAAADSNLLEQFNDLSMDVDDPRYVEAVVNTLSAYVRVTDEGSDSTAPTNRPSASGLHALSGGDNGTAPGRTNYSDALTSFDNISTPLVFNLPDVPSIYVASSQDATTQMTTVKNIYKDLMSYCEARGDAFAVLDTPIHLSGSEAVTFAAAVAQNAAASATGANSAMYHPWLAIPDPLRSVPGATRLVAPGAAVVGQYIFTDAARGVFKAPAGLGNRIAVAVAPERAFTNAELDALNSAATPVNAIRTVPGAGIVVMGARTMHNAPQDRYINVRRSMIYLKKELTDRTAFAVFENNDSRLWNQLRTTLNNFLATYWNEGGLRGTSPSQAFYVRCDATNNTAQDVLNGRVNIEVGVAVEYPAEFIVINIGQITGSASL